MDFPLNSSLILAATVGLWLLWVGPYVFRRSGLSTVPVAGAPSPSSTVIRSSISADGLSQQGNTMYNASTSRPNDATAPARAHGTHGGSGSPEPLPSRQPEFRIRYGRAALALTGALALVCTVIGLPLALFGAVSWWFPAAAVATTAAAAASLRTLAVRDRRRRVDAAFRAAMGSGRPAAPRREAAPDQDTAPPQDVSPRQDVTQAHTEAPVRQHRETVLFDAESTVGSSPSASDAVTDTPRAASSVTTAPGAADRPLTAAELRTAALEVAAKAAPAAPAGPPKTSTTPWEPVAVPKPTYVEAAVAPRPAPEPLVLPEPPKPAARTSLRPPAADSTAAPSTDAAAPSTGKINLDDVLQRRRA